MIVRRWSHGGAWGEVSEFRESYGYYIYVSRVCRSLRDRLQTGPGGRRRAGLAETPRPPSFPGTPGAGPRVGNAYRLSASPSLRKSEINRLRETHPGRPGKAGVRGRVPVGSRLTKKLQ